MSAGPSLIERRLSRKNDDAGEVCVFVRCHSYVFAVPTSQVERLLLPDEVSRQVAVSTKPPVAGSSPARMVVMVGQQSYAAWDLGTMLGMGPLTNAWVLLRVPFIGGAVPMALRTGPCLAVQPLKNTMGLPFGAFRARRSALARAFDAKHVRVGLGDSLVGLYLNAARLWTPAELESSAAALAEIDAKAESARDRAR